MKWLKSLMICIGLVSLFGIAGPAYGQDKAISLVHKGQPGIWMPEEMGKKVLADVKSLKVIRDKMELIETTLELKDATIQILDKKVENADKSTAVAEAALDDLEEVANSYEKELNMWYNKPWIWIGVGAVGIIIIEVGVGFLINSFA